MKNKRGFNIFISYRRDDSAGYAGRLLDSLEAKFGGDKIFRDIEDIEPGTNFADAIEHNLEQASVLLVVIGKQWLTAKNAQGLSRLSDSKDFVRLEIETGLRNQILMIPVLIDGAKMPNIDDLPKTLAPLIYKQAIQITDSRWDDDVNRLSEILLKTQNDSKILRDKIFTKLTTFSQIIYFIVLLCSISGLYFLGQRYFVTPDFSGNWYFEGGDYLLIKQDGVKIEVEHIDPNLQKIFDKGAGAIKNRRAQFDLEPIYTDKFRYQVDLEMALDKSKIHGKLLEVLSNEATPIELSRTKPED